MPTAASSIFKPDRAHRACGEILRGAQGRSPARRQQLVLKERRQEEWRGNQAAAEQRVVSFEPGRPIVRYLLSCETVPSFGPRVRLDDNVIVVGSSFAAHRRNDRTASRIENF